FVGDSRSEKDSALERKKIPQAINLEWTHIGFADRSEELAVCRIVIVDSPVAKVADPKLGPPSTRASPHGALRLPFETRRLRKLPLVSNTLTKPLPGPATSSSPFASCRA